MMARLLPLRASQISMSGTQVQLMLVNGSV